MPNLYLMVRKTALMASKLRDNRRKPRWLIRRGAEVIFPGRASPADCVIWDWSDGGARLAIAAPIASLPRHFTLVPYKGAKVYRECEVVWTDTRFVGVKFIKHAASQPK